MRIKSVSMGRRKNTRKEYEEEEDLVDGVFM